MTDNQEIVLNYLKEQFEDYGRFPVSLIAEFVDDCVEKLVDDEIIKAYRSLTNKEEFEVLAVFAEWGLKQ